MIEPEGNFSVIWYYSDKKIYVTHISRAKISSTEEYDCDSALNIKEIKEYEKKHFLEVLDADIFQSSFYDTETDSLYKIEICLDVTNLKSKGSDSPFLKELREHIIKYKLWDVKPIKVWKEGRWEDVPQDSTVH